MIANSATQNRVCATARPSSAGGRKSEITSRSQVEAITSSTLSSDDIAAASMATRMNAAGSAGRIPASPSSVGTTRSDSASPLPITAWA